MCFFFFPQPRHLRCQPCVTLSRPCVAGRLIPNQAWAGPCTQPAAVRLVTAHMEQDRTWPWDQTVRTSRNFMLTMQYSTCIVIRIKGFVNALLQIWLLWTGFKTFSQRCEETQYDQSSCARLHQCGTIPQLCFLQLIIQRTPNINPSMQAPSLNAHVKHVLVKQHLGR